MRSLIVALLLLIPSQATAPSMDHPKIPLILQAIMKVESNNGQNLNHKPTKSGQAYGFYGEMPKTIKYTVQKTPSLRQYSEVIKLNGFQLKNYMLAHPELEHKIALVMYDHLNRKFKGNPQKIGLAWLVGDVGISRMSENEISSHWHTIKIIKAYDNLLKLKNKTSKRSKR